MTDSTVRTVLAAQYTDPDTSMLMDLSINAYDTDARTYWYFTLGDSIANFYDPEPTEEDMAAWTGDQAYAYYLTTVGQPLPDYVWSTELVPNDSPPTPVDPPTPA